MDPDIGYIDENGLVTPLKAGDMWIQVRGSDGRFLDEFHIVIVGEKFRSDCLEYAITSDGNGYKVVGCNGEPERITIPAVHEGLPVVGFEPGAFKNCTKLTDISLEEGHSKLYMENDALYADLPEKTLLCYPGSHLIEKHYYIASGTKAIAAYAIANSWLSDLTIPEGVISIGDRAFYRLQTQLFIYIPDSLSEFGNYLFQSQQSNAAFYVNTWESPAAEYAKQNNIPCGVIVQTTPEPTVAPTPTPVPTPKPDIPSVEDGNIVEVEPIELTGSLYETCSFYCFYDLSDLEENDVTEVRLAIRDQWKRLTYYPEMAQQTGLYGAGYTGQKAILRAYDRYGRQIDAKYINGSFTFSFDGAYMLGVSGGRNTKMTVLPTKPVFITTPGRYTPQPDRWHDFLDGNIYQFYIIAMPRGTYKYSFPDHLNIIAYHTKYCTVGGYGGDIFENVIPMDNYVLCMFQTMDSTRKMQIDQATFTFDSLEILFSNEKIGVYASSLPKKSPDLGENIRRVFDATLDEMLLGHFPVSRPIQKICIYINGNYPAAYKGALWLNDSFYEYEESDACAISHESIHAVDQNIRDWMFTPIPSSWYEGRAEYISKAVCSKLNVPYTSNQYGDGKDYNWNFVSEIDRKDFFEFYYHSTNRYTTYSVGYYFYDFLIDTYGSDVGARVMNNLATFPFDTTDMSGFFKHCVEAATEIGVFQRFVEDVIIPSGT